MTNRPDWYPDPTGRHEHRYHNGQRWTADVATGGERYVDPLDGPLDGPLDVTASGPTNGMAIAALTCGIVSLAFGWIPVLFVVGAILAVLAVVFGVIGLRRSPAAGRRGAAIAGLLTGVGGVLVAIGGLVFTVAMFRALERYENPEPHAVALTTCEVTGDQVLVAGTLTNEGDARAGFTVTVEVQRPESGRRVVGGRVELARVAAGATVDWSFRRPVADGGDVRCTEPDVNGPLPFGVVPPG